MKAPYVRRTTTSEVIAIDHTTNGASQDDGGKGKEKNDSVEATRSITAAAQAERESWKNSEARTKLKKQISELPRTGNLLTLDVKDNEIRVRFLPSSRSLIVTDVCESREVSFISRKFSKRIEL